MPLRYLFGPVNASFAEQNLQRQRKTGACLTFDSDGSGDLTIKPGATWSQVLSRLPAGWLPDFVVLYLPYASIPSCLWSAPVPLIGLALDCSLLWHYYRRRLRACDLVLTDGPSASRLAREGIIQVKAAHLLGFENRFLQEPETDRARDIDVLFIGNLNPAVQGERLPWLQRLARLSERWRVVIRSGVFGDQYHRLLRRSRIVFNFDGRRRCSRRIFESAAAGVSSSKKTPTRNSRPHFAIDRNAYSIRPRRWKRYLRITWSTKMSGATWPAVHNRRPRHSVSSVSGSDNWRRSKATGPT